MSISLCLGYLDWPSSLPNAEYGVSNCGVGQIRWKTKKKKSKPQGNKILVCDVKIWSMKFGSSIRDASSKQKSQCSLSHAFKSIRVVHDLIRIQPDFRGPRPTGQDTPDIDRVATCRILHEIYSNVDQLATCWIHSNQSTDGILQVATRPISGVSQPWVGDP